MEEDPSTDAAARTKHRIVSAAAQLFALKGISNVSLRELTTLAGVNLAAVNYHFGSKDELSKAVLDSLAEELNGRRLDQLRAVMKQARLAGTRPRLAAIVDTFLEPYLGIEASAPGALLAQLVLKHRLSPNEMTTRIIQKHFDPLAREYIDAFAEACPELEKSVFAWRYMFMSATVILTSTDTRTANRVSTISEGKLDAGDRVALRREITTFLVAAIGAPADAI